MAIAGGLTSTKFANNSIMSLDIAPLCSEDCPLHDTCTYQKVGRCRVHVRYLNDLYRNLNSTVEKFKCDEDKIRFGLHIIPLYSQLLTFKMYESAFNIKDVMLGNKVHPIYREIRETIRTLDSMMKDLKLQVKGMKGVPGNANDGDGSYGYYEKLMNSEV